ncbi:GNAT family N-acetyltransferase [Metabacillus indicus]|uniref:GNAT family N-acetyltransferase n=1 Tax=Metabacillus indicus TaxID=246786 RepID=UPI002A02F829|nr:GNAT family N-acetyltransferase [Metabacillus indicus]MDX8288628.1 GNAT family N-acetyltransferase [Metabacillus indicus]
MIQHSEKTNITFRKADFETDAVMLHKWHHEPHVIPYWKQNFPFSLYAKQLKSLLADEHQTLWIGAVNGNEMSYFETYWAMEDPIGRYYEAAPFDQGVHLLFGDPSYLGKGLAAPLLMTIMQQMFSDSRTPRLVAEPDIRNEKMIHIFKKCGFAAERKLDLPDKQALFMVCTREEFERRMYGDL